MLTAMIRYLWTMLGIMKGRLMAIAFLALFGSLIVPRGLFHDCATGHDLEHASGADNTGPELRSVCAICCIGVPPLQTLDLPAIVLNEVDIPSPVAELVTSWYSPSLPAAVGRGPPQRC